MAYNMEEIEQAASTELRDYTESDYEWLARWRIDAAKQLIDVMKENDKLNEAYKKLWADECNASESLEGAGQEIERLEGVAKKIVADNAIENQELQATNKRYGRLYGHKRDTVEYWRGCLARAGNDVFAQITILGKIKRLQREQDEEASGQ